MILPDFVSDCANRALDELRQRSKKNICAGSDGAALLAMRARLMHLNPAAQISANGSCHLLLTGDRQWIALNLSRDCDWELLPALFKQADVIYTWEAVSALVKKFRAGELIEQGRTLGLAIALAGKNNSPVCNNYFNIIETKKIQKKNKQAQPLVLDLSSLWAGPLCSQLLQQCGMRVIKVESKQRPDGTRLNTAAGAQAFFTQLNGNKECITLDFTHANDITQLKQIIANADIVIEGSRPRALRQLGIDAETFVTEDDVIWVSITGYGRREPYANWVAYGDDAAISAGLFETIDNKPLFVGDAIADPLTGLHAALVAYDHYQRRQSALIDINLHTVSKYCQQKNLL